MRQGLMNKRFGLQKLKKIAGTQSKRWFVSPHLVLAPTDTLRAKSIGSSQRLLIRTDEPGKRYQNYDYAHMPREDIHMTPMTGTRRRPVREANYAIRAVQKYQPKSMLIIHPTRKREHMAWSGRAYLKTDATEGIILTLTLSKSPNPLETIHRNLLPFSENIFVFRNNAFIPWNTLKHQPGNTKQPKKVRQEALRIRKHLFSFIKKGILSNQINPRRFTEISFLTWKDAPTRLELFDLSELRKVSVKKD